MKQTAVEWFVEQLENHNGITRNEFQNVIQQAKAMEKEQIIDAWIATDNELQRISAEKYYNETFKTE